MTECLSTTSLGGTELVVGCVDTSSIQGTAVDSAVDRVVTDGMIWGVLATGGARTSVAGTGEAVITGDILVNLAITIVIKAVTDLHRGIALFAIGDWGAIHTSDGTISAALAFSTLVGLGWALVVVSDGAAIANALVDLALDRGRRTIAVTVTRLTVVGQTASLQVDVTAGGSA